MSAVFNVDFDKHGVRIVHHFGHESYAKETFIPKGCKLDSHSHPHAHLSHLDSGTAKVSVGASESVYMAPAWILIPAHTIHTVVALTDVIWSCVWGTDDTDPLTVDSSILRPLSLTKSQKAEVDGG